MKTLLEHNYSARIEKYAGRDDSKVVEQKLKKIERMAVELGWKHICTMQAIEGGE